MSDIPKYDQKTYKQIEKATKLLTRRNELIEALVLSSTATLSYLNPRGDGYLNIRLEYPNQDSVKECFIAVIHEELRMIDEQLRELGLGSLIEE